MWIMLISDHVPHFALFPRHTLIPLPSLWNITGCPLPSRPVHSAHLGVFLLAPLHDMMHICDLCYTSCGFCLSLLQFIVTSLVSMLTHFTHYSFDENSSSPISTAAAHSLSMETEGPQLDEGGTLMSHFYLPTWMLITKVSDSVWCFKVTLYIM